jgi:hypothetical protein
MIGGSTGCSASVFLRIFSQGYLRIRLSFPFSRFDEQSKSFEVKPTDRGP